MQVKHPRPNEEDWVPWVDIVFALVADDDQRERLSNWLSNSAHLGPLSSSTSSTCVRGDDGAEILVSWVYSIVLSSTRSQSLRYEALLSFLSYCNYMLDEIEVYLAAELTQIHFDSIHRRIRPKLAELQRLQLADWIIVDFYRSLMYSPLEDAIVALVEMANVEWRQDKLVKAIEDKLHVIESTYGALEGRSTQARADRFAEIALVFTVGAIAANVAQILGTVDPVPQGAVVTALRLPLILFSTLLAALAAIFWYRFRRTR